MKSMTAYAAARREQDSKSAQVALRSLNFKYLDIIVHNLPGEHILLEEQIKREIKKVVPRGKIEVFIFLSRPRVKDVCIDAAIAGRYITEARRLAKRYGLKGEIKIGEILHLSSGIAQETKNNPAAALILPVLKEALRRLLEFKQREGRIIKREITRNLGRLKSNVLEIKRLKPKSREVVNGKEDIDEEISLALFYIQKLSAKIHSRKNAPKGKAIDFLIQEIMRELNAASSKTKKKALAFLIVEAKNYLERIREQAQNIE